MHTVLIAMQNRFPWPRGQPRASEAPVLRNQNPNVLSGYVASSGKNQSSWNHIIAHATQAWLVLTTGVLSRDFRQVTVVLRCRIWFLHYGSRILEVL